jgi:Protein of unknown function (DUF551)
MSWICVDEKMPDVAEDVLLFSEDHYQIDVGFLQDNKFFTDRGQLKTVTHWMPLPNPPEEQS